ncbi:PA3371 family protein [Pseudomonas sp. dw_358]|uniref:PA3371 family protein n=1 Tax=Pseudomonas sp. dw_358 TaxID=2720083 RepID=UPI001BD65D75|nr:PA3371 family protein [Pseudomonas sp. dw_358]
MSKSAVVFLLASLASFVGALLLPLRAASASMALGVACGVFAVMFLAALFVGRRIKFDPLLR